MRSLKLRASCLLGLTLSPVVLLAQGADVPTRLSLADALRIVEQRHPAIASAKARISAAAAASLSARQRPNPVLTYSGEGYRPWVSGSLNQQETAVEVSQELETGGRRAHRRTVAAAAEKTSEAALAEELRQVRLDAQRTYLQLVLARSELETAAATLAEVDKVIAVNRARYRQGEVSGGELRRLEVERMRFTDDLLNAELAERNARSGLLSLLGATRLDGPLEPTDGLAVAAPRPGPGAPVIDPVPLIARALDERPDLTAARHEVERARGEVQLQRALRLPTLTLGAGYRRDFGDNGLVVSAAVPLPIFDHNAGGIARANAEQRLAETESGRVAREVSLEVQQAVNAVAAARARLAALESEYLAKAREALDSSLAAYRSGSSDLIDYLDAQRAWRDVQRAHQRALFEHRLSLFQLDAAVGAQTGDLQP